MAFSNLRPLYPQAAGSLTSQSLTVSTTAVAATGYPVVAPGAVDLVYFDVQLASVFVRWDGTSPTNSVGHLLPISTNWTWPTSKYNAAKFIRIASATVDAVIFASPENAG